MSKRQDKRHASSVARAAFYDNLSADKKRAFTRPNIVSCKRVTKNEAELYNISRVLNALYKKGVQIDEGSQKLLIDVAKLRDFGKSSKGKLDFLKGERWTIVYTNSRTEPYESKHRR